MKNKRSLGEVSLSPKGKIRADKRVKNLLDDVRGGNLSVDFESLLNELERLHKSRRVRNLDLKEIVGGKALEESLLQNQAYRSRAVEIKMLVLRRRLLLEARSLVIGNYIRLSYKEVLSEYKTIADRSSVIDAILEPVTELANELSRVEEVAELLVDDIDKSAWTIKSLIDAVSLENRGRNI